jgi:hypothetical protein
MLNNEFVICNCQTINNIVLNLIIGIGRDITQVHQLSDLIIYLYFLFIILF